MNKYRNECFDIYSFYAFNLHTKVMRFGVFDFALNKKTCKSITYRFFEHLSYYFAVREGFEPITIYLYKSVY